MAVRTSDPRPTTKPTWDDYWAGVGNEDMLAARDLINLSPAIRRHFEAFLDWDEYDDEDPGYVWRSVNLDWCAAAEAADRWPCSTTERILLDLVLGLVQPDETTEFQTRRDPDTDETYQVRVAVGTRTIDPRTLGRLGSWSAEATRILMRWMAA